MDSSPDGMWAAKVDQLELEEVIKNAAIKFLDALLLHHLLLNARIQSLVRKLVPDPMPYLQPYRRYM